MLGFKSLVGQAISYFKGLKKGKEGLTQYHTLKEELQHKSMDALFLYFCYFQVWVANWLLS